MSSLAKRVRDCRYAKGWGPDELASRAEISRTALYQIESGKTELPRAGTLRRIAKALDVSIDVLLGNAEVGTFQLSTFAQGATTPKGTRPAEWTRTEQGAYAKLPRYEESFEADDADDGGEIQDEGRQDRPLPMLSARERDLTLKLQDLLASPLGEGVARILEDSHRLLPIMRSR